MYTTFDEITQHFNKATLSKKNTIKLALLLFYETKLNNKSFRVLSCAIYTMIKNYVCIGYLACQ